MATLIQAERMADVMCLVTSPSSSEGAETQMVSSQCDKPSSSARHPYAQRGEEIVHTGVKASDHVFWDTLIRTAGTTPGSVGDTNSLFIGGNRSPANTNLPNGSTLPSDQSFVALALRVFVWVRNPILRVAGGAAGEIAQNGDYSSLTPFLSGGSAVGNAPGSIQDYYRLVWQIEEQVHWTFGTGLKPSLENVPTWYLPAGGQISGDMGDSTDLIHWQNSGYDGHSGILAGAPRSVMSRCAPGELRESSACTFGCDGANPQPSRTNGIGGDLEVVRKVQRLADDEPTNTSASSARRLAEMRADEIVHASPTRAGSTPPGARGSHPAAPERDRHGQPVLAQRRGPGPGVRYGSGQPQHAQRPRQPQRRGPHEQGDHLHLRRLESISGMMQAVTKPASNGEHSRESIPCRAAWKHAEGRRDSRRAAPGGAGGERATVTGRQSPAPERQATSDAETDRAQGRGWDSPNLRATAEPRAVQPRRPVMDAPCVHDAPRQPCGSTWAGASVPARVGAYAA